MSRPQAPEHEEQGESAPLWMISFADLVTLLLSFFVILSVGNPKEQTNGGSPEFDQLVAALRAAFGNVSGPESTTSGVKNDYKALVDKLMALKVYTKPPARGETREQGILGRNFTVRKLRDGTEIALGGPVYFDALSPDPTPEGKEQLQRVVELLKGHRNIIEVRGHTADTAIPQDWTNLDLMKLSYQRAEYVGKILLANGIDSRAIRLTAAGSAEPASREKNPDPLERTHSQRVEIFVRESLVDDYTGQDPRPAATSAPAPSPT